MIAILITAMAAAMVCTAVIFKAVGRIAELEDKLSLLRVEAIRTRNELNEKERRIKEYEHYVAILEQHVDTISEKIEERGKPLWEEEEN